MNSMQAIKAAVESLKDNSITVETKLNNYSTLINALDTIYSKGEVIEDNDTIRCVFVCANTDVTNTNSDLQQSVLLTLDLLFKCKCRNSILDEIPDSYIELAFNDVTEDKNHIRECALNCVRFCLQGLIVHNKCDPEKVLLKLDNEPARRKMAELLTNACIDVPTQRGLLFFYDRLVPQMFYTESVAVRSNLIDEAFKLLPNFKITLLSRDKLELFKIKIKTSYVERIIELRTLIKDVNWHKLWIFLIKCWGKLLHTQVDIMNSLLKAVEYAFRNSITEDRIAAYDCWKELINNYSLDIDRMCNEKQMKLIITPLKINVSKSEVVTHKRFELWAHLISVLNQRSFECMKYFLDFCFGPLGENPFIAVDNPNIRSPGGKVPQLWQDSTRALLELLGHYGHNAENPCMNYPICHVINVDAPIINSSNFTEIDYRVVNAVGECSSLMIQWIDKDTMKKVVRCLWGSLLNIIKHLKEKKEVAIERVTLQLVVFVQKSKQNPAYFEHILKPVLDLLLQEQFFEIEVYNKFFLFPLIKSFLKHSDITFLSGRKIILDLVCYGKNTDHKNEWMKQAYNVFLKVEIKNNLINLILFWIECADVFIHLCRFPNEETKLVIQTTGVAFIGWPIQHIQKISVKKIANEFLEKWGITFQHMYKIFADDALTVMDNLRRNIKTTGFASNVAMLFRYFRSLLTSTDCDEKFHTALLGLTHDLLKLPALSKDDASLLLPVAVILLDVIAQKNDETTKNSTFPLLCDLCSQLLQPHEQFKILEPLDRFFENIPDTFKESVPESLCTVVNNLKINNDNKISQKASKLFTRLKPEAKESEPITKVDKTFLQPKLLQSSRGVKITQMARTPLRVRKPTAEANNLKEKSIFQKFGKNIDSTSTSPFAVRGSLLNNSTPKSQKRKAANVFSDLNKPPVIDHGDEANYVLIDSQYKFDKEKLSEHQLETFKKRKSDIPALYQDLSQSQSSSSQSLFETENKTQDKETMSQRDLFCSEDHSYTKTGISETNEKVVGDANKLFSSTETDVDSQVISATESVNKSKAINILGNVVLSPAPNIAATIQNNLSSDTARQTTSKSDLSLMHISSEKSDTETGHKISENKEQSSSEDAVCFSTSTSNKTELPSSTSAKNELYQPKKLIPPSDEVIKYYERSNMMTTDEEMHDVFSTEKKADLKIRVKLKNSNKEETENASLFQDQVKEVTKSNANDPVSTIKEQLFALNAGEENKEQDSVPEKELKRLSRVQKELNKIKMDIVGGDKFVQNLNLAENKIRTRGTRSSTKIGYDSDDGARGSGTESNRKSKLRATVAIVDKSKDKRILSPKNKATSPSKSPNKNKVSNGDVQSSPRRKLVMDKVDENGTHKDDNSTVSSDLIPKRRRRRSILSDDDSQDNSDTLEKQKEKADVDEKKISSVRKCLNDIMDTPAESGEVEKLSNAKGKETKNRKRSSAGPDKKESDKRTTVHSSEKPTETDDSNLTENNTESQNTEDVIESSQESYVEINPCQNYSKSVDSFNSKSSLTELNSEIQQIVSQMSQRKLKKVERINSSNSSSSSCGSATPDISVAESSKGSPLEKEDKYKSECESQDTQNTVGICSPDELMRIDLTSRIISLSAKEQNTCEMDTQTAEMLTPRKSVNIPSSPVNADTPTRTCELIKNTVNISPIKSKLKSKENGDENINPKTPDLFDSEMVDQQITDENLLPQAEAGVFTNEPENDDHPLEKLSNFILSTDQKKGATLNKNSPSSRSARLLNLVSCIPSPNRTIKFQTRKIDKARQILSSPKGIRTMKMMQKCEVKLDTNETSKEDVVQVEDSDEESKGIIAEKDLLQFVRELPGPTASPKFSILKRRRSPDKSDEGLSPPRKQKRVNFCDPPMTCRKIFIRDENEHPPRFKIAEALPQHLPNPDEEPSGSIDIETDTHIPDSEASISHETPCSEIDMISPSSIDTVSPSSIETQGSLDVTDPHLLDRVKPIFPELIYSKKNVHHILSLIVNKNNLYMSTLFDQLHDLSLHTVGDFAKLTELEVNRLPLKTPKVVNARNALAQFYKEEQAKVSCIIDISTDNDNDDGKPDPDNGTPVNGTPVNGTPDDASDGITKAESNSTMQLHQSTQKQEYKTETQTVSVVELYENNKNEIQVEDQKTEAKPEALVQSQQTIKQLITEIDENQQLEPTVQSLQGSQSEITGIGTNQQVDPKIEVKKAEPNDDTINSGSTSLAKPVQNVEIKKPPMPVPSHRILRRIPLKAVYPSTAVAKPKEILETVPPQASTSNIVMEERKKLQGVMTDLMNDFKKLQQKVSQQGLKESSLYETIIEMVGAETFVSILQNNKSLCLTHFLKDNDWTALFREILDNLGVRKFMFWLTRTPKLTLINLFDAICEQMTNEDVQVQKCAMRLIEIGLSLCGALKPHDIQSLFSRLFQTCQISKFSTEEILQFTTFKLSPSIKDSIPSFRHINVIQLDNKTLQCSNAIRKDLNNFVERLTTAVEESELPTIFPKNKLVVLHNYNELSDRICASKSNEVISETITKLFKSLSTEELTEEQAESIICAMFSKVPYATVGKYFSILLGHLGEQSNIRLVNMSPL